MYVLKRQLNISIVQEDFYYEKSHHNWCTRSNRDRISNKIKKKFGNDQVLATDIKRPESDSVILNGPFEILDVTDKDRLFELVETFKADTIMHMAALLSATAEKILYLHGI